MHFFKRTALATAIAFTTIIPTIESVEAAPRSYFSYVDSYAKYPSVQISFVQSMIANYTRTVAVFNGLVEKYARFSQYSFYQNMVASRDWYAAELSKYEAKLAELQPATTNVVTVVNTETTRDVVYEETKSSPVEVETAESVVEETIDDMVYVYAVLTKVFETTITTKELTTTTTITYYSNNTSDSESKTELTKTETQTERETVTSRELIDQYAVVDDQVTASSQDGIASLNILTKEEYLARDDVSLAGTETYTNAALKMSKYLTDSYIKDESGLRLYGDVLNTIKAPDAWARGWTGKGSTIAILDTGIDLDHTEFAGKIEATKCFIIQCDTAYSTYSWYEGNTVQDFNSASHGTHVAGIAAAALDGVGTTGVAPDANLIIGKVATQGGYYNMGAMADALGWASNNGAVVANVSANLNVPSSYRDALTKTSADTYQLIDNGTAAQKDFITKGYDTLGFATSLRTDYSWATLYKMSQTFVDTEMVMVASAGNQSLGFSTFPAHYAVYTDASGNLLFDGRIIVAGNWDIRNQSLAASSNAAGTVCYDTVTGTNTCDSGYRIKDFYLMAPGMYVASADNTGEYRLNSGTSQAAPMISGAVAIIHQMWPHMKGTNIAKLLLSTGNKDIPNYDENIHGQGLLDLEAATRPQGTLGIPTDGRVGGTVSELSGGIAIGGSTASISALDNVMVLDSFERDFYFNANDSIDKIDTRTMSYTVAHKDKVNTNAYAGYTSTQNAAGENFLVGASSDLKSLNVAYDFDNGVSVGYLKEEGTFLGNVAQSSLMKVDSATTLYVGYNAEKEVGNGLSIFGGATVGFTKANVDSSAMMKSMDTLVSNTANIGAELAVTGNSSFGLVAALPVAITSGSANFKAAQSINTDGSINYANVSSSLAGEAREYNVGAYYNFTEAKQYGDVTVSAYVEERVNYLGQSGETDTAGGIKLKVLF